MQITKIILILTFCAVLTPGGYSQEHLKTNEQLLIQQKAGKQNQHKHHREYVYKHEKSWFKKYNPVSLTFGALLYFYQNVLSPQFSADCLFHPTCSDFSKQAIREYGLAKGVFLSADRITRCNRIAATSINLLKIDPNTHHAQDSISLYRMRSKYGNHSQ